MITQTKKLLHSILWDSSLDNLDLFRRDQWVVNFSNFIFALMTGLLIVLILSLLFHDHISYNSLVIIL